ncbi:unnamed protein product, partial [Musa textilis]
MLPRGRMERDPSRRRRQAMWSAARHHPTRDPVADVDVCASPTETPHPVGLSLTRTHDDDRSVEESSEPSSSSSQRPRSLGGDGTEARDDVRKKRWGEDFS